MTVHDLPARQVHERALDLAAVALDFALSRAETAELEAHLASCPSCARRAAAMRGDALALGRPLELLPSARVDAAIAAEIAGRRAGPQRLVLVAAAAMLALALLGAAAVGAYLLRNSPTPPITEVTLPTATPVARPTASTETTEQRPDPTQLPSGFPLPRDAEIIFNVGEGLASPSIATGTIGGSAVQEIAFGQDPSFLPDRDQIVFACADSGGSPDVVGVCLSRFDGSNRSLLVDDPTIHGPRWSPDGSWLTYGRGTIDVGATWIANKDASSNRMLFVGTAPIWSADGRWLAYQPDDAALQVAIIKPDGSRDRVVGSGYDPAWSQIAARLAFVRLDGSKGSLLVASADAPAGTEHVAFEATSPLHHPAWLSETMVAFWMDGDLYRLDLEASDEPLRLTTGLGVADGAALSVSPDAAWLMFSSPDLPDAQIYIVSIDGGWAPAGIELGPASNPIWRPEPPVPSPAETPTDPSEPTSYEPPLPLCPAPAAVVEPPAIAASAGGRLAVSAVLGSYTTTTCATTGTSDAGPTSPSEALLAEPGETITLSVPTGWRFVHWEGWDAPVVGEGANVWQPTELPDPSSVLEVPVPSRTGDSNLGLDVVVVSLDGRVVISLSVQLLVRVG